TLAMLASLAGCTLDELIIRGSQLGMIETGIKVLDLLAPIVRGGYTGIVARPGIGQLVMLSELLHRLRRSNYATLFWKPAVNDQGVEEAAQEAESTSGTMDRIFEQIKAYAGEREVIVAADRSVVLTGELFSLTEKCKRNGIHSITTILV